MLPTPSTAHADLNRIYEPSEDSYLLLDTLSSPSETAFLTHRFSQNSTAAPNPTPVVLEVGTGSGVVLAFATANAKTIFGRDDILAIGTDVNRFACQATRQTVLGASQGHNDNSALASKNGGNTILLAMLNADLTNPMRLGMVDVLIFNPPYVPSSDVPEATFSDAKSTAGSFGHDSHLLALSYEGGVDGMEVTNRLLEQLPEVLECERGVAYILLCQQNRPEEAVKRVRDWGEGWSVEIVGRSGKVAGWEKLCIIRIWRIQEATPSLKRRM
jgi:release factor glutamine methyltransferase